MQAAALSRFTKAGPARAGRANSADAAAAPPAPEHLPLLGEWVQRAQAGGRNVVLDLAPASAAGIELYNALACRLHIVDFPAALPQLLRASDREDFQSRLSVLLPGDPAHPLTMVMCWDFLNYLPPGAITMLLQHVAEQAVPGARVHALIAYSSPEMPARPCRYTPAGHDSVQVRPLVDEQRKSPRYTPNGLLRHLPGFEIERAMLLRNGYQEYLFRLPAAPAPDQRPPAMAEYSSPKTTR